jgi:ribosomal protein L11 methyltransferase
VAWLGIRLTVPAARIERLGDALLELGAQSVALGDAADAPVFEPAPGETPLWPRAEVDALFDLDADVVAIRGRLEAEFPLELESIDVRFVEDTDWSRTWRDHAPIRRFGERLWVAPRDAGPIAGNGVVLRLDPGLAFGTGGHATTALCLEWLATHHIEGRTVVDYGAGSGILAIAALLLGADRAIAIDHDPQALVATHANATYNDIAAHRLTVSAPDELPTTPHDLVLANILAGPLTTLAPTLQQWLKPGGRLVISGMLAHQVDAVLAQYPDVRFESPQVRDSWAMVEGTKAVV